MFRYLKSIFILGSCLAISACTQSGSAPTAPPTASATLIPALTETPLPTLTPTATDPADNVPNYTFTPVFVPSDFQAALARNRAIWESKGVSHYTISVKPPEYYNYERVPWTIEVNEDQVVTVFDVNGIPLWPSEIWNYDEDVENFFSVPALFSSVEKIFEDPPPRVEVEYDPEFGYPTLIAVDPFINVCCDKFSLTLVDNLQVLP